MKILRQKEFTGAKKITQQLKQWDIAMPLDLYKYIDPKKVAKDPYTTKKGRIKLAYNKIRNQNGGVVGKTDEFDKSFYKAKTLSPKRRAVPRDGNERGYLAHDWEWEGIAKEAKVKK